MTAYGKPLPRITPDNRPFWDAARCHRLALQRCADCARFRYPPAPVCPACLSDRAEWAAVSGQGAVSTFVVFHQRYFPSFAADIPYNVVQVELDEGPRLTANLIDVPNAEISIGMRVEVIFDDVTSEISLPRFRRAAT